MKRGGTKAKDSTLKGHVALLQYRQISLTLSLWKCAHSHSHSYLLGGKRQSLQSIKTLDFENEHLKPPKHLKQTQNRSEPASRRHKSGLKKPSCSLNIKNYNVDIVF